MKLKMVETELKMIEIHRNIHRNVHFQTYFHRFFYPSKLSGVRWRSSSAKLGGSCSVREPSRVTRSFPAQGQLGPLGVGWGVGALAPNCCEISAAMQKNLAFRNWVAWLNCRVRSSHLVGHLLLSIFESGTNLAISTTSIDLCLMDHLLVCASTWHWTVII